MPSPLGRGVTIIPHLMRLLTNEPSPASLESIRLRLVFCLGVAIPIIKRGKQSLVQPFHSILILYNDTSERGWPNAGVIR
jgi:hypothetical protein